MNLIRPFVPTNRYIIRAICILPILLLLNGCAVMAGVPVPIRIASNIHSGYTLYKNLDDDPENDSWYVGYIKSIFGEDEGDLPEPLYAISDDDKTIILNNESLPKIKL